MRTRLMAGLVILGGLACEDPPARPRSQALDAGAPVPAAPARLVPEVFVDLVAGAARAHVRRAGPFLRPDAPGWARVAQLADRGPWMPHRRVEDRRATWLDGIGGTLWFPVGADGGALRDLLVWLRPVARGQVVSVFLDEQPVTTMRLKRRGTRYRIPLPTEGLEAGEHSLRFWFRFTRFVGKTRTPGALGFARVVPAGEPAEAPEEWTGSLDVGGRRGPALLAGPPAAWSFYLLPPVGARLFARAAVVSGPPVEFTVWAQVDGEPPDALQRLTVPSGTSVALDVALRGYEGQPVRLSLKTEGEAGALGRAGWIEPTILHPGRARVEVPVVRNVIVWAVDGLRADRVGLGRGGDRAATPNLDLLADEGAAAVDLWSGGASATAGHRRLLRPSPQAPSLPALMAQAGLRTGVLSASSGLIRALTEDFSTRLDLRRAGEPPETRILLRELDAWLDVRKRQPFFLYVASDDPRYPFEGAEGYRRMYERARPHSGAPTAEGDRRALVAAYDAQLSTADYWIGQMIALLQIHGVADQTAILVVGTVGQELRESGGVGDGHALVPEVFQVPLVVWHPGLRGARRPHVRGGDLADVAATALLLAGGEVPPGWPTSDLFGALFEGIPLAPRPSHARLGNQVAARFGDWLLRGASTRDLKLWNLRADPVAAQDVSAERPIALRTLRDSMLDALP